MNNNKLIGITECRYEPLHKGHVYMALMAKNILAQKAREQGKDYEFHIIVCSHSGESIPGYIRYEWAQRTFGGFPKIKVHLANNMLELLGYGNNYNGLVYKSDWKFWAAVAVNVLGFTGIDYVFGSEEYVFPIAEAVGAKGIKLDEDREALQISGTVMRNNPYHNWDYFPDAVKPYFSKKVCIIGAPYTGKAKLAKALSNHYSSPLIGDVSEKVYDANKRGCTIEDLDKIALLHDAHAAALLQQTNKVTICDSDALLTKYWAEAVFGKSTDILEELTEQNKFDLYLVTDTNGCKFKKSHSFPNKKSWDAFTKFICNKLDTRNPRPQQMYLTNSLFPRRVTDAIVAIDNLKWDSKKCQWT